MTKAAATFDKECVRDIKARPKRLAFFAEQTVGKAALLNEDLGFMGAAEIAMKAIEEEKTVREVAEEQGVSTAKLK
jgi:aspartate ammonia-lyase